MTELSIRLKRKRDGSATLTCTRADGSVTWQRQTGRHGLVFPAHDLTHFALETSQGYARGFYGLIAAGWEIGDFSTPWPRGPVPAEAREVELVVGLFDSERRMGECWTAQEFYERGEIDVAARRTAGTFRDELLARWAATGPGETLELTFPVPAAG